MQDRRQNVRDKVLLGGVAEIREIGSTMDCVVRNFSERGACVEFSAEANLPEEISLTIKRKGRSYLARMIWRHADRVGLAFRAMVTDAPVDDFSAGKFRGSELSRERHFSHFRDVSFAAFFMWLRTRRYAPMATITTAPVLTARIPNNHSIRTMH